MTEHQHEEWQLHTGRDGGVYCAACGTRTSPAPDETVSTDGALFGYDQSHAPTPDGAAREAERLHREGYEAGGFEAGAAWQRARIAARRDEAVRDLVPALAHLAANMSREERHAVARVLVDAALAALEVSDR